MRLNHSLMLILVTGITGIVIAWEVSCASHQGNGLAPCAPGRYVMVKSKRLRNSL
jgi:hypothetical protein